MAFDASGPGPDREPDSPHQADPIDYVDWAMRIVVFGPLLALYAYWIWTILRTVVVVLLGA